MKLEQLITAVGPGNVLLVFTCITNNPICGQPVPWATSVRSTALRTSTTSPDLRRCAGRKTATSSKMNEDGYADKSIAEIATEMFSLLRRLLHVRQEGRPRQHGRHGCAFATRACSGGNFSDLTRTAPSKTDAARSAEGQADFLLRQRPLRRHVRRDIMALAVGMYESCDFNYMDERIKQCEYLAQGFYKAGVRASFFRWRPCCLHQHG